MLVEADVLIIGGGVAGSMAAISAARNGVKTVLIERSGVLGGMWTAGFIGVTLDGDNKGGVFKEFSDRVAEEERENVGTAFEIKKAVLEKMCLDAGVEVLFGTTVVSVAVSEGKIVTVEIVSKSFCENVYPKIVIDATGDGDVAYLAGCEYDIGLEGKTQPMSMVALVSGVGENAKGYMGWNGKEAFKELLDGVNARYSLGFPNIAPCGGGLYQLSINQEFGYIGTSAADVTRATMSARQEIFALVKSLKKTEPFKNIALIATPELIGVREGRRIRGRYQITVEDIVSGKKHENPVCTVTYWVDIHSFKAGDKGYSDMGIKSQPYDIPLDALLAKDIDNLVLAGRCISGDFYAHASYRVMGNMAATGDAAGKYAAKSVLENKR